MPEMPTKLAADQVTILVLAVDRRHELLVRNLQP